MTRLLPNVMAILLVIISGMVKVQWADHATAAKELQSATARIGILPWTIGDWTGEPADLDERGLDRAGIVGHINRCYTNRRTGASVTMLLVFGRPGPIAVHGPEICYTGAGYEQVTPIVKRTMGAGEFWTTRFRKEGPVGGPLLQIDWAWSAGGRWEAAKSPRIQYSKYSVLYKLYILSNYGYYEINDEDFAVKGFAVALLPELRV